MQISIKATNITLTESIEEYAHKKFESVEKFIDSDGKNINMFVELGKTTEHHRHGEVFLAEINMHVKDKDIYVHIEREDLYVAIDDVRQELLRELKSIKSKRINLIKRGGAKIKQILKGIYKKNE